MKFHQFEWWEYKTFICGGPSFYLELYEKQKDLHTSWSEKKNINFQFLIVVSEIHLFYFSKEKNVTMSMLILDNENSWEIWRLGIATTKKFLSEVI